MLTLTGYQAWKRAEAAGRKPTSMTKPGDWLAHLPNPEHPRAGEFSAALAAHAREQRAATRRAREAAVADADAQAEAARREAETAKREAAHSATIARETRREAGLAEARRWALLTTEQKEQELMAANPHKPVPNRPKPDEVIQKKCPTCGASNEPEAERCRACDEALDDEQRAHEAAKFASMERKADAMAGKAPVIAWPTSGRS